MEKINVSGFNPSSIVDGTGIRFTIYTQGCKHHCQGCHNRETWNFDPNQLYTIDELINKIADESFEKNVTLSGGDPLFQISEVFKLCTRLKENGYNIWLYTGYTLEQIKLNDNLRKILTVIDVLVDGKFVEELRDPKLKFIGSSNQRIIEKTNF